MDWKQYEREILSYFQETFPETIISFDKKIVNKYSKVERQIDILIEGEVANYPIKIAVDCKYFATNIDVKHVESFCSMLEDIEAHQGVLISKNGYSQAAINRAYYGNHKIELDIINFDDLKELQSFVAIPYIGHYCITIPAPFGWVIDLKNKINSLASIHQRGLTLRQAQKKNEWMYMQFWEIQAPEFDIDQLIELQNKNILENDPEAKFTYNNVVKRNDNLKTKIRIAEIKTYSAFEVTGFIELNNYIFFIVLFTPKELLNKNLRKLQFLLKVAAPRQIKFDNKAVIEQCLVEISQINDKEKKAENYYQIGIWYEEMGDVENTVINLKKAIECFPAHYSHLKGIISKTLSLGFVEESAQYVVMLFEIEPTNPTVPSDLIDIFLNQNKSRILVRLFLELIGKNKNPEVLGNLNFHLGQLYFNINEDAKGMSYLIRAKKHFRKIFPLNHPVFRAIKEFEKE